MRSTERCLELLRYLVVEVEDFLEKHAAMAPSGNYKRGLHAGAGYVLDKLEEVIRTLEET